jgi:hypothetical protein
MRATSHTLRPDRSLSLFRGPSLSQVTLRAYPSCPSCIAHSGFRPCSGTDARDTLYERGGRSVPDTIYGLQGRDRIFANLFGGDRDLLYGNRGDDNLNAQDGDGRDELYGGQGDDVCYVDEGDSYRGCEEVVLAIE